MFHAFSRTFALPSRSARRADRATSAVCAPLTPAAYLRLRREAAGLTVDQVARRLAMVADDVHVARDVVHMIESPGVVAKRPTLDRLRTVVTFDLDVYRQLATEPADRHPQVCRGCGCSKWDACDEDGQGCAWATPDACTRCLRDDAASAHPCNLNRGRR